MKIKIYIYSIILFLIDYLSKSLIVSNINLDEVIEVIPNFFYLDLTYNTGAAFSILTNYTYFLAIIGIFALFYIDKQLIKKDLTKIELFSIILLNGGIIGNLFDRVVHKYVIDFLSFKFGNYYFPIFNLADIFVCLGAFGLIIIEIVNYKKGKED